MRLADTIEQWQIEQDWQGELERDEAQQTATLEAGYRIKEQSFKLYLETDEENDWLAVYLYAPFNALEHKQIECALLCNSIDARRSAGSIHVLPDGRIRYRQTIDVEGMTVSGVMISNLIQDAGDCFFAWLEEIAAVALTEATAEEVLAQLDQEATEDESEQTEAVPEEAPEDARLH
ncbi:type III secretion system chaperone family protein [Allochromatium vinosum]|uniref:Sensory transduction regulator n=1 Tax=Allochromatium vinosum (strain ATCC 17899 / DSM 180 / NBRC 103801 / NCIMB 10441 / D) TaxID=572477 RepID=D3RMT1_ALLVD|nr:YbjN domain-containing protein [Allochromatium vinosum]ADC63219.1 Protein of unknown function DUF1790 [Allochromatium vinosum DSM 180]